MSQLLIGVVLIFIGVASLIVCLPRKGKKAWFVGKPLFESGVPILMITMFAIGIMLVAAHFTTIDDATLAGAVSKL
jgi:hypothetical protein